MIQSNTPYVKHAENCLQDELAAVRDIASKIMMDDMEAVLFFCSPEYDLPRLAQVLKSTFSCTVFGCTSAGEIASTYQTGGIVAVGLSSRAFRVHLSSINSLATFNISRAKREVKMLEQQLEFSPKLDPEKMFSFMLIDGLSLREEQVASCFSKALKGVALVGGSAADDLNFTGTHIFSGDSFRPDTAVVALIETKLSFEVFKFQHVRPTDKEMIVTSADPARRTVYEINGLPAATELARIMGIEKEELTMQVYSTHPVMLNILDDWYIRSIMRYNDDDSLDFACAIDSGLPLTVGEVSGLAENLRQQIATLSERFSHIYISLGCDCIHRRLEILHTGLQEEVEGLLADINFVGFSTYGEQYNSLHVNQTLTGVVIGNKK